MSIVDANGNVNDKFLQQELLNSLASDVRYKQVDNMKKRAVKVATDYEEFKAMVACAHLKKISSKEVQELSAVKKGWKKGHVKDQGSSAQLLAQELDHDQSTTKGVIKKIKSSKTASVGPRTCMEIERDLRRLSTNSEKLT